VCKIFAIFLPFAANVLPNGSASVLFWQKMIISDNAVLFTLSRLISNQFMAVGSHYGITSFSIPSHTIRFKILDSFASSLMLSRDVHNSV